MSEVRSGTGPVCASDDDCSEFGWDSKIRLEDRLRASVLVFTGGDASGPYTGVEAAEARVVKRLGTSSIQSMR